jgi:hypothetical protein
VARGVILVLLILAAPAAADAPSNDVRSWTLPVVHTSNNGTLPYDATFPIARPHTLDVEAAQAAFQVTGYVVMSSASLGTRIGDLLFTATVDSEAPRTCNVHYNIPTGQDRQIAAIHVVCPAPPIGDNSTLRLQAAVQPSSGTAPVEAWAFSYTWMQTDVIPMELNLATALDAYLPIAFTLFWLAVLWWSTWRMSMAGPRYLGIWLFATIGMIASLTPDPPAETWPAVFTGLLLGVAVVALADRFGTQRGVQA